MEYSIPFGTSEAEDRFDSLDDFTRGYIEAAFWTDCNPDSEELCDKELSDLDDSAWDEMIKDCKDFQETNADDLEEYYKTRSEEYAGHDFWLTRNRHGAGFWDRGLGELGNRLTKESYPYGSTYLYLGDDGKVYIS